MIPSHDNMPETEQRIVRYVLGQLQSPELEAVEDRLLADEAFFEQVEALEAEVCDDYVAGRLSAVEQLAFETRLSGIARLQRRVAFARALAGSATEATSTATWWWAAAAAAALIVATAGAMWFTRDRTAPAAIAGGPAPGVGTPPQISSPPAPSGGQPRVTPVVLATLTLFGPVVRDAGEMPVITIPTGQGVVRLEVALQDGDVFPSYRAEITSQSGAAVFTADRLLSSTSSPGASGRTVVTDLAPDRLPDGTYQMSVFGLRADGASRLATYPFRVKR